MRGKLTITQHYNSKIQLNNDKNFGLKQIKKSNENKNKLKQVACRYLAICGSGESRPDPCASGIGDVEVLVHQDD